VIRFHIKSLVLGWLGSLSDPTVDEWNVIAPHLRRPDDPMFHHVWALLFREPWFERADSQGEVEKLLRDEDPRIVDRAVSVMRAVQRERPERVAELLEPFIGQSDEWNQRLVAVAQWADLAEDRRFFKFFLLLIDTGVLDEARGAIASNSDFWDIGYGVEDKAAWAVEYIEHFLRRRLSLARERGIENPFDYTDGTIPSATHGEELFQKTAEGAPQEFVERLLPIFLDIMAMTARDEHQDERLRRDPVWSYRYRNDRYGTAGALLEAMERALQLLAERDPERFTDLSRRLGETGLETANFLAVRGFLGAPSALAEPAAAYLLADVSRFRAGYADDDHWATRELLASIYEHLSGETRDQLEEALISYETPWERSAPGHKSRGRSRFVMLTGLPEEFLSKRAAGELLELRRKFERDEPSPPRGIIGGFVGSPIPSAATKKMSDEQWVRAIERYSGEREWHTVGDTLRGGAEELAHELEQRAKEDPRRFATLSEELPDHVNTVYFDAILRGVAGTDEPDVESVLMVCRRCHTLPGRPCGRWITMPIERISEYDLPEELLEVAEWYAVNDPDPTAEIWRETPEGSESPYYGGDIHTAGINSARGAAAMSVGRLIGSEIERAQRFDETLEKLAEDPSVAVRSCAAYALLAAYTADRDRAVSLFERLVDAPDELLATPWVERFAAYASRTHPERIEPIIRRMLNSDSEDVQQVGGRQAVLASIAADAAIPLAREAAEHASPRVRRGAAQVAAANAADPDAYQHLAQVLTHLFDDADDDVRDATSSAFRRFIDRPGGEWAELLQAFVASTAFRNGLAELFFALGEAKDPPPYQTVAACARLGEVLMGEAGGFATRGLDTDRASQILLRMYQAAEGDPELRLQALDAIDQLAQLQVYGIDKALAAFER
jgi:tetratricopeptide (TPR) repeat protein